MAFPADHLGSVHSHGATDLKETARRDDERILSIGRVAAGRAADDQRASKEHSRSPTNAFKLIRMSIEEDRSKSTHRLREEIPKRIHR